VSDDDAIEEEDRAAIEAAEDDLGLGDVFTAPEPDERVGAPPGELRLPDELAYAGVPRVTVSIYDVDGVETRVATSLAEIPTEPPLGKTLWIGVEGLADLALLKHLQRGLGIHPLAMEDALSRLSRPKLEVHGDVVMMVAVDPLTPETRVGDVELVTMFLGERFVLTIEDAPGETFDAVRKRVETAGSRLRRGSADVLFQALVDNLVDRFFPVLDAIDERLEELDDAAEDVRLEDVTRLTKKLHDIRQTLQKLRRYAAPLREAVNGVMRRDVPHVDQKLHPYFVDVVDHLSQIVDHVETAREFANSVRDLQFSFANTRMNEIMRGLTVISTIFLPLSFIASLYGMNFANMPELRSEWGYPAVLLLMFGVAAGSRWFFKRKKWI
jgi:magnesium transporter